MKIKVKNTFNSTKEITFLDGTKHSLKTGESILVGDYSDEARLYIFNMLKKGYEVSKVNDDFILETKSEDTTPEVIESPPKKKRGRPKKVNN